MYLFIQNTRQGMRISADGCSTIHYIGYSKREAIRNFRQRNNLVGKHMTLIEL